jgi:hydroxymethylpyrimidine pyrophosphatase-like HAD family hydrolase
MPLYVIGSGGSFSAATFASILHQQTGVISKCLTPFEFLAFGNMDKNCSILIITAGGNNKDILSAFDKAVSLKPKNLGILCTSTNNKLIQKASKIPKVLIQATKLPIGKDGFLATNSLLASIIWMIRAYEKNFMFFENQQNSISFLYDEISKNEFGKNIIEQLEILRNMKTIVILYDIWGKTAAIDAESKLTEAGLVNVQLADYRNFAHGRHNWLDKNKHDTGIIALITPKYAKLADNILNLIPKNIKMIKMSSYFDNPVGSLSLLIKILYTVKFFGKVKKIDPGMPHVAMFGRKIYHLSIPKNLTRFSNYEQIILQRKFPECTIESDSIKDKVISLRAFVEDLHNAKFGGIIFDYDGTLSNEENRFKPLSKEIGYLITKLLRNNIIIGIATGRGKSVREEIQERIPKKYWQKILIGYYNGAEIGYLDDDSKPDNKTPPISQLETFFNNLKRKNMLPKNSKIEKRHLQISIQDSNTSLKKIMYKRNILKNNSIKIVESSHSIDILAKGVSKINLFKKMKNILRSNYSDILCIGDKGKWPGNDFELLNTKYSLSVDEVSDDLNSCWNILSNNIKGEQAVIEYLQNIKICDNYFMIKSKVMK